MIASRNNIVGVLQSIEHRLEEISLVLTEGIVDGEAYDEEIIESAISACAESGAELYHLETAIEGLLKEAP